MSLKPYQANFEEKLSAGIGLVLGLLFIGGGIWVRQLEIQEHSTLIETQGRVVDNVSRRGHNATNDATESTFAPVVEFQINGDKPIRFTGDDKSYRTSKGQVVVVRYNPKQPHQTARIVEPLQNLTPWAMFGIGGIATATSLVKFLPFRWSTARE